MALRRLKWRWVFLGCLPLGAAVALFVLRPGETSTSAASASASAARQGPSALSIDRTEWDFGIVKPETGVHRHTFTLTNVGSGSAKVWPVRVGCGCLALECPESVPPGSSKPLRIELELRNREGPFSTLLTLGTSDEALSMIEITLKCYIQPRLEIDPPFLQFSEVTRGDVLERELLVATPIEPGKQTVAPVVAVASSAVRCEHLGLNRREGLPGRLQRAVHRYRVRIDSSLLARENALRLADGLRIKLPDTPAGGEKLVPVEVHFCHHPWLRGQTAVTLKRSGLQEARVRLWSKDGKAFAVAQASCSIKRLSAKAANTEPAKLQEIVLAFDDDAPAESTGIQSGTLQIVTAEQPNEPYQINVLVLPGKW